MRNRGQEQAEVWSVFKVGACDYSKQHTDGIQRNFNVCVVCTKLRRTSTKIFKEIDDLTLHNFILTANSTFTAGVDII